MLTSSSSGAFHKIIWKSKIPEKIKIFLWLMANNAVLTRDNMKKRKWNGDSLCIFCNEEETISHLFFKSAVVKVIWMIIAKCLGADDIPLNFDQCWIWCNKWLPRGKKFHAWGIGALCWAVWKYRSKAVFDKKLIKRSGLYDGEKLHAFTDEILVRAL